jgi:L,D-transpeptidase YcbB
MFYLKQYSKSAFHVANIIFVSCLLSSTISYADPNQQITISHQNLSKAFPAIDPAPVIFDIPSHGLSASDALRTSKVLQIQPISEQPTSPQIEPINNPFPVLLYQALNAKAASHHPQDEAIKVFYEARAYSPLWLDENGYNSQAKAIKTVLENAASHGLKPSSYKVQEKANNRVEAEISITTAAIHYARDARGARLNPRLISRLITAEPTIPQTHEIRRIQPATCWL